ncbi:MAG: DUF1294 domain-containing protein [Firmicutes bacterium]|nr:DUF1294 domain-containing protein [Bacillota bacterium]
MFFALTTGRAECDIINATRKNRWGENVRLLLNYLKIISLVAAALAVYDKHAAQAGKWRVKEKTLMLVAVCGGAVAMGLTMYFIRHKTRKTKFVVGIPLIIVSQLLFLVFGLDRAC